MCACAYPEWETCVWSRTWWRQCLQGWILSLTCRHNQETTALSLDLHWALSWNTPLVNKQPGWDLLTSKKCTLQRCIKRIYLNLIIGNYYFQCNLTFMLLWKKFSKKKKTRAHEGHVVGTMFELKCGHFVLFVLRGEARWWCWNENKTTRGPKVSPGWNGECEQHEAHLDGKNCRR